VLFHIDPHSEVPIYLQIVNQVKRAVASGVLVPGDRLPTVRQLAVDLTINPNTVAKAYQELEREGVISTVPRRGTFVSQKKMAFKEDERIKILEKAIDSVLVEAHHLGFSRDELLQIVIKRMNEWFEKRS